MRGSGPAARARALRLAAIAAALGGLFLTHPGAAPEIRQSVYVGARVCAGCHEGKGIGHQYSRWLLSKHSKAYAALSMPEAAEIAKLSGIPSEPKVSQNCLGCHATASDAEPWEKDPGFALEDGIQCERCHGPGSDYMDEKVMRDRDAAVKAGLSYPTSRDCMLCHYVKGSHVAVHHLPQIDVDRAFETIAHPTPAGYVEGGLPARPSPGAPPATPDAAGAGRSYIGARACGACHDRPDQTCRFSRWRSSSHADAYAVLSTPKAEGFAKAAGISGDPQRSAACLSCHATAWADPAGGAAATYGADEGVGCEACHGAGSAYGADAIMKDAAAARASGLRTPDEGTCRKCHAGAHGKSFDAKAAIAAMTSEARASSPEPPSYKTPQNLAMTPDGKEIWIACEASGSVVIVDTAKRLKVGEVHAGGQPVDVAFSPDGRRAYVSCRLDDAVAVIDTARRERVGSIAVGDEPHGLLTDPTGRRLYVLDTAAEAISIVDTESLKETGRLAASRGPWSMALSPDGGRLLVTNYLSRIVGFRKPSISEITVVDPAAARVPLRLDVPAANLMLGVAWHPGGEYALATLNRTKNLVPMTRIQQGWTITNGLAVIWKDGRVDQVLLDEPNLYFPDATDVAFTPDGRRAVVTSAGSDRAAIVDTERLTSLLRAAPARDREHVIPNDLGASSAFVVGYVATGASPRGVIVAPDGRTAFTANALDDSLTAIDLQTMKPAGRIDLGGPVEITRARRGERLFNSADITFQRQFACHSCHPDGHIDGLAYDIEADGIGVNPVDNRTLRGIIDTDPFKWAGTNPSIAYQCGPRLAVFFTRLTPFTPAQLDDLTYFICTIPRPPNRYRPVGAELTPAQRRGKILFDRARTSDGREIPFDNRCSTCHNPPLYTDRSKRDVGTKLPLDQHEIFDVPHLNNIYDSAPYLHDGIAATLEEIWTRYNPYDKHGVTNDLTKDQLNDLIEFLRTL